MHCEPMSNNFITEEMSQGMEKEKTPETKIVVPNFLISPHSITAATRRALNVAKEDDYGAIKCTVEEAFYVRIAPDSIDRTLRIIDALISACAERRISTRDGQKRDGNYREYAKLVVNSESLGISIDERIQRRPHKLTEKEMTSQRRARKSWDDFSYMSIPKYDYFPTGKLSLKIEGHCGSGLRSTWNDTNRQKIEDCLNQVIVALLEAAAWIKNKRKNEEEREQLYRLELTRRAEKRRQFEEEHDAISQLERDSNRWQISQKIRAYAAAVEHQAKQSGPLPDDKQKWLEWAREHADRMDPLCESKPSSLNISEEEMRPISIWEMPLED
jgi:hypothetical protein